MQILCIFMSDFHYSFSLLMVPPKKGMRDPMAKNLTSGPVGQRLRFGRALTWYPLGTRLKQSTFRLDIVYVNPAE